MAESPARLSELHLNSVLRLFCHLLKLEVVGKMADSINGGIGDAAMLRVASGYLVAKRIIEINSVKSCVVKRATNGIENV